MPTSPKRPRDDRPTASGMAGRAAHAARAALDRWRRLSPKGRGAIGVALAAAVSAGVCFALLRPSPEPRARQYLAFKACLLTDSHGITGKEAATVWEGMQRASSKTHAKIQYLAVAGPATVANARPYLASLVQRRCGIILAAGELPTRTVTASAQSFGAARFVVVGKAGTAGNVVTASATGTSAAVERIVSEAVG
ncbi:BMP family ABC transporter substrate-binding protein [Actinomadura sp. K4S16]|uniref:BMP family ABC transporter substrate-binding protein n=1 Tax=Actinomadura sp. K4S16 TaxID=1316147 RepID=UPI0011ED5B77|nr:BMP family ABC transporter substrate-binding protein [Actinomadura sp. K4S16]